MSVYKISLLKSPLVLKFIRTIRILLIPETKIRFDVSGQGLSGNPIVTIKVYDMLGREVAVLVNEQLKPGTYEINWSASNVPSGIYFYNMTSEFHSNKKNEFN